ncbi:MAG: pentapeptide repeat-containing protein [Actinocatenispora sp.]
MLGLILAVAAGIAVIWWLLSEAAGTSTARAGLRIDAIRTGLTVVAGTGGAVALLFGARRQWLSERAQRHRERVDAQERAHAERLLAHEERVAELDRAHRDREADQADQDSEERRITELYTAAVSQLGSVRAAVRLAGLYALERLAHKYAAQRQTIVDVLCGYLRMATPHATPVDQEHEVRRTAQRILCRHLQAADVERWADVRLDLSGAELVDFDATGCQLTDGVFTGARFTGSTRFDRAVVDGRTLWGSARFTGSQASFRGALFETDVALDGVRFACAVDFSDAVFAAQLDGLHPDLFGGRVQFIGSTFRRTVLFDRVRFGAEVSFERAAFDNGVSFEHAEFHGVRFRSAHFRGDARFQYCTFAGPTSFRRARFEKDLSFDRAVVHSISFAQVVLPVRGCVSFEGLRVPTTDLGRASADGQPAGVDSSMPRERYWPPGFREVDLDKDWRTVEPEPQHAGSTHEPA